MTLNDAPVTPRSDGFRGIWFTLGQFSAYGDKYSGGLGIYTSNHVPMAIYAPEVNKTFFTYGGTRAETEQHLLLMVAAYDHATGLVSRPVIVHDKQGVNDPHDNATMALDEEGHIWIFISGRNTTRKGYIYRSRLPYGIGDWVYVRETQFAYPQPWWIRGKGMLHLYTRYIGAQRQLFWESSRNGDVWSAEGHLSAMGGQYQISELAGEKVGTTFNRHPNGNVDARTDLYYLETPDLGATWRTAAGASITPPLVNPDNPARIRNYSAEGRLVYLQDLAFDHLGNPAILYVTSAHYQPGPQGDPRCWELARWDGAQWRFSVITTSTHNYDVGSLYIESDGLWRVIGPTEAGPQYWGTGGEVAMWVSQDQGATWEMHKQLTSESTQNHAYVRRPRQVHPGFYAYWMDGNPDSFSPSRMYFTDQPGTGVWQLPYSGVTADWVQPIPIATGTP